VTPWRAISFTDDPVELDAVLPSPDIVAGWVALFHAITDKGDRCLNCAVRRSVERGRCRTCYCHWRNHGTDRPSRLFGASTARVRTVPSAELQGSHLAL
jgi:hypothetical protein